MKLKRKWTYLGVAVGAELMRFGYTDRAHLNQQLATIGIVFLILSVLELLSHWTWGESE